MHRFFLPTLAGSLLLTVLIATLGCGGKVSGGSSSTASNSQQVTNPPDSSSPAASAPTSSSTSTSAGTSAGTSSSTSTGTTTTSSGSSSTSGTTTSAPAGIPSNATVYSHIEDMSGWASCTSTCSGGNGTASFSLTQQQASPSLDGSSTLFSYDGGPAFSHILWSQHLSSNGSATNFVLDMYYYIDQPASAQGLEFAANQQLPGQWYKFSTQCSFADGKWRVWDSANQGWVATSAPCTRPPANTWQHLTFDYQRANAQAVFVAITVNGQKYDINQSFNPQTNSGSTSVGVHFEMDGDGTAQPYNVWIDQMTLSIW